MPSEHPAETFTDALSAFGSFFLLGGCSPQLQQCANKCSSSLKGLNIQGSKCNARFYFTSLSGPTMLAYW